jgi:hypothetical protein
MPITDPQAVCRPGPRTPLPSRECGLRQSRRTGGSQHSGVTRQVGDVVLKNGQLQIIQVNGSNGEAR